MLEEQSRAAALPAESSDTMIPTTSEEQRILPMTTVAQKASTSASEQTKSQQRINPFLDSPEDDEIDGVIVEQVVRDDTSG